MFIHPHAFTVSGRRQAGLISELPRRVLLGNPLFSETRAAPVRYPCIGPAINAISLDAENSCLSALLLYANVNEGFI